MRAFLIFLLVFMAPFSLFGSESPLKLGEKAPDFAAPDSSGKTVHLKDFLGKWVILYFYPKAFTPGCTQESCALRDGYSPLQKKGAVLLGVSLDSVETQKKFREKYQLPFELLSDEKKEISKQYGTLALLGLMTARKTFVIDPQGKIAHIFESVDTKKHDQEVLQVLEALQKSAK